MGDRELGLTLCEGNIDIPNGDMRRLIVIEPSQFRDLENNGLGRPQHSALQETYFSIRAMQFWDSPEYLRYVRNLEGGLNPNGLAGENVAKLLRTLAALSAANLYQRAPNNVWTTLSIRLGYCRVGSLTLGKVEIKVDGGRLLAFLAGLALLSSTAHDFAETAEILDKNPKLIEHTIALVESETEHAFKYLTDQLGLVNTKLVPNRQSHEQIKACLAVELRQRRRKP